MNLTPDYPNGVPVLKTIRNDTMLTSSDRNLFNFIITHFFIGWQSQVELCGFLFAALLFRGVNDFRYISFQFFPHFDSNLFFRSEESAYSNSVRLLSVTVAFRGISCVSFAMTHAEGSKRRNRQPNERELHDKILNSSFELHENENRKIFIWTNT